MGRGAFVARGQDGIFYCQPIAAPKSARRAWCAAQTVKKEFKKINENKGKQRALKGSMPFFFFRFVAFLRVLRKKASKTRIISLANLLYCLHLVPVRGMF
jgi:hypothetical protein